MARGDWAPLIAGPGAEVPGVKRSGPAAIVTAANALNLTEPSGQYASGQVWTGSALPESAVSAKVCSRFTVPRAHGTPQVTPTSAPGAPPSSQRTSTPSGAVVCADACCSNAALDARIPIALRLVIFIPCPLRCNLAAPRRLRAEIHVRLQRHRPNVPHSLQRTKGRRVIDHPLACRDPFRTAPAAHHPPQTLNVPTSPPRTHVAQPAHPTPLF